MSIKSMTKLVLLALLSMVIAACHHSGGSGSTGSNATEFSALVTDLIQNQTTDTAEPVSLNGRNLAFDDEEGQFDELLEN